MRLTNNTHYCVFVREFFDYLPYFLVKDYAKGNNCLVEIGNESIKNKISVHEIDRKVSKIIKEIFENGKCRVNIFVSHNRDKDDIFLGIGDKSNNIGSEKNITTYTALIFNNNKIIKNRFRKKTMSRIKNSFLQRFKLTSDNDEILYDLETYENDKIEHIKITKDIYISLDQPEQITSFYYNYRTIRMKRLQIKYVKYVIDQINVLFEKIYNQRDILKYNGIELEFLEDIERRIFAHKESMTDINRCLWW